MRLTKYLRAHGEEWMVLQIRCSAHVSYTRLDNLLRANGWVHWSALRERFNELKKKIAKADPVKFPNWKEVKIPMRKARREDLPEQIRAENDGKNLELVEVANEA